MIPSVFCQMARIHKYMKGNNASYTLLYVTHKTGASISPSIPLIAIIPGLTTCSLRRKKLFLSKLLMLDSA